MFTNKHIKDLAAYFKAKANRTEEEDYFLNLLNLNSDLFPITAVAKEDLEDRGFDTSKVSDGMMDRLADRMSEDYVNQLFWPSLDIIAEEVLSIPKEKKDGFHVHVEWDTHGDLDVDLPDEVEVPANVDPEEVSDWLSNKYGWCVISWCESKQRL